MFRSTAESSIDVRDSAPVDSCDLEARTVRTRSGIGEPGVRANEIPPSPPSSATSLYGAASSRQPKLSPEEKPLAVANRSLASHLHNSLMEERARGNYALSNARIAKPCGVTEKIPRDWVNGERYLPVCALPLVPPTYRYKALDWVHLYGRSLVNRAVARLRETLAEVEEQIASGDRGGDVLSELAYAKTRIEALIRKAVAT